MSMTYFDERARAIAHATRRKNRLFRDLAIKQQACMRMRDQLRELERECEAAAAEVAALRGDRPQPAYEIKQREALQWAKAFGLPVNKPR